ncbi:MAG TPA: thioredoxin domain-containing protein [Actinocatenispora sp.]
MNRLAGATSPYLLQHATNPVDWWEWGAAAMAEARRRDVPLLISVGYAACHWCHVMAHESFEDPAVAAVVNEAVVPVKVDREERPDVDAVYMTATQAMTGQGGWPMTVFATPDGAPFWCGTYLPAEQFTRLVRAVTAAWRDRRDEVVGQGDTLVEALRRAAAPVRPSRSLDEPMLVAAVDGLAAGYDATYGGFGSAPKFPPSMVLEFLLRQHALTGDARALDMARGTCDAMARGGMYDQLVGGFARYSVDATWTVPHFEKMLYDNALLLRAYTHLWRATGDATARRVATETVGFLLRDLRVGPAFAASLDADAAGVEGSTYVWTPDELRAVLGDADGDWAADVFGVTAAGTFEHGTSVLRLPADPADTDRWSSVRERLSAHRATRPQPARDDKVVAAWNGLAVTALVEYLNLAEAEAEAGADLGEVRAAVVAAGRFLAEAHVVDGRLRRVSRDGRVGEPAGVLDDHGSVAQAFCALHQHTADPYWLGQARLVLDAALAHFRADGAWYDTADDAERLVSRPADPTDNATPSGLASVAEALVTYAALTGETTYREAGELALAVLTPIVADYPRFAGHALAVGAAVAAGPLQVAVVGDDPALRAAAWAVDSPGAVVVAGAPDAPGVPLLADRPLVDGRSAAYVCRGFVCDRPVTTPAGLRAVVAGGSPQDF